MLLSLCVVNLFSCLSTFCEDSLHTCHYPSTVNIACQQLTYSSCQTNNKLNSFCLELTRGMETKLQTEYHYEGAQFDGKLKETMNVGKELEVEGNGTKFEESEFTKGNIERSVVEKTGNTGTEVGANGTKTVKKEATIVGNANESGTDRTNETKAGNEETEVEGNTENIRRKVRTHKTKTGKKETEVEVNTWATGTEVGVNTTMTRNMEIAVEDVMVEKMGTKIEGSETEVVGKKQKTGDKGTESDEKETKTDKGTKSDEKETKTNKGTKSDEKETKTDKGTKSDEKETKTGDKDTKKEDSVRIDEKSTHVAILTEKMVYILELPTYRVAFKTTRPNGLSYIHFNQLDKRLYWVSMRNPRPAVGYFLGDQRKQILSKPKGSIGSIAFEASTFYFTYSPKTGKWKEGSLYSAKVDMPRKKLKFICMLPASIGPMMMNAKLSTIYINAVFKRSVVEVNMKTGKVERKWHKKKGIWRFLPLIIAFVDKDTIYMCVPGTDILALDVETWTVKQIEGKMTKGLKGFDVRQDKIILVAKTRIYMYDRNWTLINDQPLHLGKITIVTLMT